MRETLYLYRLGHNYRGALLPFCIYIGINACGGGHCDIYGKDDDRFIVDPLDGLLDLKLKLLELLSLSLLSRQF